MRKLGMVVLVAFALCACSKSPKYVGVMKVPVYPGAKQVDHETSHSQQGDDISNLSDYTFNQWKFESKASPEDILAFYADKVPDAKPEEDDSHGLRWNVHGPKVSEIDIHVDGSTFSIGESTKD